MRRGSYTVVKLESCPENSAHNGAPADPAAMSVPSVSSLERLATPPRIEANAGWRYASECEEGRSPTAVRATSDEQRWRPPSSTRLQKVPAEDEAKRQALSNQEALSAEFLEQTSTMHRRALIELQSTLSQKASASYFDDNYAQTRIDHIERMQALARRGEMPRRGEFLDSAGELRHDGRKHSQY